MWCCPLCYHHQSISYSQSCQSGLVQYVALSTPPPVRPVRPARPVRPVHGATKKTREPLLTNDSLLGGGYLLSHFRSTIGVVRLNFSVRNGKRWDPHAMTTLSFIFYLSENSPYGAFGMRRGCDGLKRPSGERCARKPRDFTSTEGLGTLELALCAVHSRLPHTRLDGMRAA